MLRTHEYRRSKWPQDLDLVEKYITVSSDRFNFNLQSNAKKFATCFAAKLINFPLAVQDLICYRISYFITSTPCGDE